MNLTNNLTFALAITDGGWRTDLTLKFCEFFSFGINGGDFMKNIVFPANLDDALENCKTDYLLYMQSGFVPFNQEFFTTLEQVTAENSDIFIGNLEIADDYVILSPECVFINIKLWRDAGQPKYVNEKLREGPECKVTYVSTDKYRPHQVAVDGEARVFVPGACAARGAELVIRQLDLYGTATSFSGICGANQYHFLDTTTPYREIHTETIFEKQFLAPIRSQIFGVDNDNLADIKDITVCVVAAPAQGLKALTLAEYFKARTVIVYDYNPLALELQKMIFSVTAPTLYQEVMMQFREKFPNAEVLKGWEEDEYSVIVPLKNVAVEFRQIDAFSFELEDLVKSIDHRETAVFDFSDIFVYPYNYYKRGTRQVQGLFAEIYSLIKSRTASSHILGFAPGFQNMNTIEVNTSRHQYEMDPTIDLNAAVEEAVIDDALLEIELVEELPIIVSPVFAPIIDSEQPKVEVWIPPEPVKVVLPGPRTTSTIAAEFGYTRSTRGEITNGQNVNFVIFSKQYQYDEFLAYFEFSLNEITGEWNFNVGKADHEKRITFLTGMTEEALQEQMAKPVNINPKTVIRYFK